MATNEKCIYTTTNYERFKRLLNNRDIKGGGVKNIIDSINTIGYITNPIIVNEKYEVIDGQHRLEALKALNMPVDYIEVKGAGINECRLMNRKQGNWTTMDYLKSYARSGNPNYMNLYDLILQHPKQKLQVIVFAITGAGANGTGIQDGNFICDKTMFREADEKLSTLDEVIDFIRKTEGRTDYLAMAYIYALQNRTVDSYRLKDTIVKRSHTIRGSVSLPDALDNLSEAYNFKARNKVYLKTDWLRENESRAKHNEDINSRQRKQRPADKFGGLEERRYF